jgi:hypothetical protein
MPEIELAPDAPGARRRRRCAAVAAALAVGTIAVLPATSSAQSAAPLAHTDVQATCGVGVLELTGTEVQHLDPGVTVVVTDTLVEGGASRPLASTTLTVPVTVNAAVAMEEPVRFRSTTSTAGFTFVRTTSVHRGAPSDASLLHRETLTVTCTGDGPGSVTVAAEGPEPVPSTTTTAPPAPHPTPDATPSHDAAPILQPARAVATAPRYTA